MMIMGGCLDQPRARPGRELRDRGDRRRGLRAGRQHAADPGRDGRVPVRHGHVRLHAAGAAPPSRDPARERRAARFRGRADARPRSVPAPRRSGRHGRGGAGVRGHAAGTGPRVRPGAGAALAERPDPDGVGGRPGLGAGLLALSFGRPIVAAAAATGASTSACSWRSARCPPSCSRHCDFASGEGERRDARAPPRRLPCDRHRRPVLARLLKWGHRGRDRLAVQTERAGPVR